MADFAGLNSMQGIKVGEQWQILLLYDDVEQRGLPEPLAAWQSGLCLSWMQKPKKRTKTTN